MLQRALNASPITVSEYVSAFSTSLFRGSRSQMSFKRDVFKKFRNIHRKTTVLKTLCNKVATFPINIAKFLKKGFLIEHLQ